MRHCLVILVLLKVAFATENLWYPDCGKSNYEDAGREQSTQIVNGWDARKYEFPWQVSLVNRGGTHFCGGSLITNKHVLTAAHCIGKLNLTQPEPQDLLVDIAKWKRANEDDNPHRQRVSITKFINHEDYTVGTYANDVSILVLTEELDFSQSEGAYGPICKPDTSNDYIGSLATVSGWGTTISGGLILPNTLQYTNLDVMDNTACRGCMDNIFDSSLCAGNCGQNDDDSCQGDSGGPLAVKNAEGNWEIIGIVSWGYNCAGLRPGVYARVTSYIDWIDGTIAENP